MNTVGTMVDGMIKYGMDEIRWMDGWMDGRAYRNQHAELPSSASVFIQSMRWNDYALIKYVYSVMMGRGGMKGWDACVDKNVMAPGHNIVATRSVTLRF